jgi:hypothetical protein
MAMGSPRWKFPWEIIKLNGSGWWFQPTPLKNDDVKVSWDYDSFPTEWKNKMHVPNHQPEMDGLPAFFIARGRVRRYRRTTRLIAHAGSTKRFCTRSGPRFNNGSFWDCVRCRSLKEQHPCVVPLERRQDPSGASRPSRLFGHRMKAAMWFCATLSGRCCLAVPK